MKPVIVCVATTPTFQKGMERLRRSCEKHWKGDLMFFTDWPKPKGIKSYTQSEMPYQFKVAAIQQAIEAGYTKIIWLDSCMQLVKDPIELFDEDTGLTVFHNLGHPVYKYLSDDSYELLQSLIYHLEDIKQIWGGAFMLDISKYRANMFFELLKDFSLNGSFKNGTSKREGFVAHRHDQAVMSVLCDGHPLLPYGMIASHEHYKSKEYGDNCYILYSGI